MQKYVILYVKYAEYAIKFNMQNMQKNMQKKYAKYASYMQVLIILLYIVGNTSGIVTSGTRTGFLVCTWFVPVYTGTYLYVLLYTKFQSTYQYVLSMSQNKVMHI
jgi:hypothetical protein